MGFNDQRKLIYLYRGTKRVKCHVDHAHVFMEQKRVQILVGKKTKKKKDGKEHHQYQ